ncbi:MAG: hypothetical protein RR316_05800, partial [Clostridia bacterium]
MSKNNKTYATTGNGAPVSKVVNKNLLREKVIVLSVLLLFVAAVITGTIIYANYEAPIYSEITNKSDALEESKAIIKNGGFDIVEESKNQKLGFPLYAKNWTLNLENNAKTIAGVIPTSNELWAKAEKHLKGLGITTSNPGVPNTTDKNEDVDKNFVYMISNKENTYASIKTYSSIQISAKSYNKLTFWVKTENVSGSDAYIWVKKSSSASTADVSFTGIVSGEWKQYSIYIEGSDTGASSVYLEVGLGQNTTNGYDNSKGTIFIDNIVLASTTKGDYLDYVKAGDNDTIKTYSFYTDKKRTNIARIDRTDSDFEEITAEQYTTEQNGAKFPFSVKDDLESKVYKLQNLGNNCKGGQLIEALSVKSPSTSTHFRLSFYIRTVGLRIDQGANIYMYDSADKLNGDKTTFFSKIKTTENIEKDTFNGWVQYSFYVKPSNTVNYNMQLEIWLGDMIHGENIIDPVNGTLYVTDIELNEINMDDYSKATADSFSKKVDLTSAAFTPMGTSTLPNGSFENYATNVSSNVYPFAVSNWTADAQYKIGDINFGIVGKNHVNNATLPLPIASTDFINNSDDVIHELYIYNKIASSFGVRSEKISLLAQGYYRISVAAKALNGGKVYVYLTGDIDLSNNGLTTENNCYSPDEVKLANGFVQYNFYIATGAKPKTVYLSLYNGMINPKDDTEKAPANSAVLFDIADYSTITKENFIKLSAVPKEDDKKSVQIFETYKTEDENGKPIVVGKLTSKYDNIVGLDISGELGDQRPNDPEKEPEKDDSAEPAAPIDLLTLMISL